MRCDAMRLSLNQSAMHLKFLSTTLRMINVCRWLVWLDFLSQGKRSGVGWRGEGSGGGVTMWHCT